MTSTVTVGVIIVAAGSGTRLGHMEPKAFVPLGGRTILERSLDVVLDMAEAAQVVVVVPEEQLARAEQLVETTAGAASGYVSVVVGGSTRQQSVAAGLAILDAGVTVVLVHDCARPFVPSSVFAAVIEGVRSTGEGVVPGLPVTDTLKRVNAGVAIETVDRAALAAVQTPQGFPRAQLEAAHAAAGMDHTDDAALFAAAGHRVHIVDGDPAGFKVTTGWDLARAERLVRELPPVPVLPPVPELTEVGSGAGVLRTGVGIDVHAYDSAVPLWLGGLYWPDEPGLAGHSDGDALSHALCDALLSAAGLGDIGGRFGTSDPRFAGAHGETFISDTIALVAGAGYIIQNVAVQIVGNRPRLSTRRVELEKHLGELVGAPVSVSATTSDGLGFTGRGEGLAAYATALLSAVNA